MNKCPQCASPDDIGVNAFVQVRLVQDGLGIHDYEVIDEAFWETSNRAFCGACGWDGPFGDTEPQPEENQS